MTLINNNNNRVAASEAGSTVVTFSSYLAWTIIGYNLETVQIWSNFR